MNSGFNAGSKPPPRSKSRMPKKQATPSSVRDGDVHSESGKPGSKAEFDESESKQDFKRLKESTFTLRFLADFSLVPKNH
jgi:hypothetical protein